MWGKDESCVLGLIFLYSVSAGINVKHAYIHVSAGFCVLIQGIRILCLDSWYQHVF